MNLLAYNSIHLFDIETSKVYQQIKDLPGIKLYSSLFYLFARNMSIVDRTNSIEIPLKTKNFDFCALPNLDKTVTDYNEVVNNRAKQLLSKNKKIVVMWSGGVDSTLILASLIVNCNKEQLKSITVLLNKDSILENYNFYKIILKNFLVEPSEHFHRYIGNDEYLYVTGEGNDQLFASLFVIESYKNQYGKDSVFHNINQENLINFISNKADISINDSEKLYNVLNRVAENSPTKIDTVYKFMWWITFTLKWQSVYTRSLLFSNSIGKSLIPQENYTTFYHCDEFQQWAINYIDTNGYFSLTDGGGEYKLPCKKYIYDVDKNYDYLINKNKQGSYSKVIMSSKPMNFMLEDYSFRSDIDFMEVYNPNNSFV
jgi:hypothetical protein